MSNMRGNDHGFLEETGFTLIEVMMVLAVISILAMVTVPKYQAVTDQYHLESSADNLAARLRNAKQLAMDRRQNMAVGVTSSTVQIFRLVLPQQFTPFDQVQNFDSGVQYSSETNLWTNQAQVSAYVYFDYRGFSQPYQPGLPASFTLSSLRTGRQVNVNVDSGTGNVTISWP